MGSPPTGTSRQTLLGERLLPHNPTDSAPSRPLVSSTSLVLYTPLSPLALPSATRHPPAQQPNSRCGHPVVHRPSDTRTAALLTGAPQLRLDRHRPAAHDRPRPQQLGPGPARLARSRSGTILCVCVCVCVCVLVLCLCVCSCAVCCVNRTALFTLLSLLLFCSRSCPCCCSVHVLAVDVVLPHWHSDEHAHTVFRSLPFGCLSAFPSPPFSLRRLSVCCPLTGFVPPAH